MLALTEEHATLGVPHLYEAAPKLCEHAATDFAREGSAILEINVLRTDLNTRAAKQLDHWH